MDNGAKRPLASLSPPVISEKDVWEVLERPPWYRGTLLPPKREMVKQKFNPLLNTKAEFKDTKNRDHFSWSTQSHSQFLPISVIICHDFVIEFTYPTQFERESLDFLHSHIITVSVFRP
jgi:hypothetical protein